jgi:hypothetical protein
MVSGRINKLFVCLTFSTVSQKGQTYLVWCQIIVSCDSKTFHVVPASWGMSAAWHKRVFFTDTANLGSSTTFDAFCTSPCQPAKPL